MCDSNIKDVPGALPKRKKEKNIMASKLKITNPYNIFLCQMAKTSLQQKIFLEFLLGNPEHYPFNRNIKKKQIFLCCGETENVVAILIPTTLQYRQRC